MLCVFFTILSKQGMFLKILVNIYTAKCIEIRPMAAVELFNAEGFKDRQI
jgi:hypothetical protein